MKQNRIILILSLLLATSVGYNIGLWFRLKECSEACYWMSGSEYQSIKQEIQRLEKESKSINP